MPTAHSHPDRRRSLLIGISLALLIFIGYEFKIILNIFTIRQIDCILDKQSCPQNLQEQLEVLKGKSLFATDYANILHQSGLPLPVTLESVDKELPTTVSLEFVTQPLAYQLETSSGKFSISQSGIPFKETTVTVPITITLTPSLETILENPSLLKSNVHQPLLLLAQALQTEKMEISKVTWVDKDTITLIMDGEPQTVILDSHNPAAAVGKLKRIIASTEYRSVAQTVREIDLRFDLPVLRMQQ